MACLLVPVAEAIVVTAVKRKVEKKERESALCQNGLQEELQAESGKISEIAEKSSRIPWGRKLRWLSNLLWGGSFLLLIEHIWHGEVVPWPPFLTAMGNPADMAGMFQEMAMVGTVMTLAVTGVWALMVWFAEHKLSDKQLAPAKRPAEK